MQEPLLYIYYAILEKEPKFELGITVMTRDVKKAMCKNYSFYDEVNECFQKYSQGDWGQFMFNSKGKPYKIKKGESVIGKYKTSQGDILIQTEHDRSVTTIMLQENY